LASTKSKSNIGCKKVVYFKQGEWCARWVIYDGNKPLAVLYSESMVKEIVKSLRLKEQEDANSF